MANKYVTNFDVGQDNILIRDANVMHGEGIINVKFPPDVLSPVKGDGSNETTTLQAMINYAISENMALFFPEGVYAVDSINVAGKVSFIGSNAIIRKIVSSATPVIKATGFLTMRGMNIDGNISVLTAAVIGLDVENAGFDIADCSFVGCSDCIHANINKPSSLYNCNFETFNEYGLHLEGTSFTKAFGILMNVQANTAMRFMRLDNNNNIIYGLESLSEVPIGVEIAGDFNYISARIPNCENPVSDVGQNNNFEIISQLSKQDYGNKTEKIAGDYTQEVGDFEGTATGHYRFSAPDIALKPENPLEYKTPTKYDESFDSVPMKDAEGNVYDVAVLTGENVLERRDALKSNDLAILHLGTLWRDYSYQGAGKVATQQGVAVIDDTFAIIGLRNDDDTKGVFVKVNYRTGQILATSAEYSNVGHVNDATYNPKSGYAEFVTGLQNGIARVNVENCALVDTKGSRAYTAISYNYSDGFLYARSVNSYYKIDPSTYAEVESMQVTEPTILTERIGTNDSYRQGMFSYKNMVACMYWNPNTIIFYEWGTGNIMMHYDLPLYANDGVPIMEPESGDILEDGTVIMVALCNLSQGFKTGSVFLEANFQKNVINGDLFRTIGSTPTNGMTLYVDATANNYDADGTDSKPFRYVQEAINACYARKNNMILISLRTAGNYGLIYINGMNNSLRIQGVAGAVVNSITVERSTDVDIRTVDITPVFPASAGSVQYPIYVNQARVNIESSNFNGYSNPKTYYGVVTNGELHLYNGGAEFTKATGYTNAAFRAEKNSILNIYGWQFSSANVPECARIATGSVLWRRPPGALNAFIYESGFGNPSLVQIATSQALTVGTPITLDLSCFPNGLNYICNMMNFVMNANGLDFPFTVRITDGTSSYHMTFVMKSEGDWYLYDVSVSINTKAGTITPTGISCTHIQPKAETYTPAEDITSGEFFPTLDRIDLFRV